MADPKKMSVADMLAAARKKDGSGGGDAPAKGTPPSEEPDASVSAPAPPAEAPAAQPKPAPGGKLSVAEMMAMARAEKAAGAAPVAKPAAPKAEKPVQQAVATAAAKAAKPVAKQAEAAATLATVDTSSILAAARQASRPGPMSKSEAVAKVVDAPARPLKEKVVAPPMPAKPAYAKPKDAAAGEDRRGFLELMLGTALGIGFTSMSVIGGLWSLATARFMFPNVLTEPPSRFKVGFPANFPPGSVDEKFKAQFGVWIVNAEYQGLPQIVAIKSVCTHLGCTPNWLDGEQKFKCPCHGSGFYKDGINFEGPAPRPLERYAIRLADDGQLEVDKSKLFQEELGQWADAACFAPANSRAKAQLFTAKAEPVRTPTSSSARMLKEQAKLSNNVETLYIAMSNDKKMYLSGDIDEITNFCKTYTMFTIIHEKVSWNYIVNKMEEYAAVGMQAISIFTTKEEIDAIMSK